MKRDMTTVGIKQCIFKTLLVVLGGALFTSCNRDEEPIGPASFPKTAEIYTDNFIGLGTNFYFPFVDGGAKPDVFSVDQNEGYESLSSIRIDVPASDDPGGSFAGAAFIIDGAGRNLTTYNALTFWAKANVAATIDEFGFGVNSEPPPNGSLYQTAITGLDLTSNWQKFIVPIPNSAKLTNERGMFYFATPGICQSFDETGNCNPNLPRGAFTFWIDEIQFENLGTIRRTGSKIQNGQDQTIGAFPGESIVVTGASVTFNMPSSLDLVMNTGSAYFDFISSNDSVLAADGSNLVVEGEGTATITASIGDLVADGSLTVESIADAPTPSREPRIVTALFSDAYSSPTVDFYNGFWEFSTTKGGSVQLSEGKNVLRYSELNFVGIQFTNPTLDASDRTHVHFDLFTFDDTEDGSFEFLLVDAGEDQTVDGSNDVSGTFILQNPGLSSGEWISLDIRLDEFAGLNSTANLAQLVLASEKVNNVVLDNIYFYSVSDAQDASLSNIQVDGSSIPGFASGVFSYQFPVSDTESVPVVTATTNNDDASLNITPASSVPGTTRIEVVAPNGVNTQVYNVSFVIEEVRAIPLDFESDQLSYPFIDFGGGVMTRIDNPDQSGLNLSNKVARMVKNPGEVFGGSSLVLQQPMDFSVDRTFSMKVWVAKPNVPVLLKVENSNAPENFYEVEQVTSSINEWEELTFDFSPINPNNTYDKVVWIFENGTLGDGSESFTYFIDDVVLFQDLTADATLSDLLVDGSTIDNFSPSTFNYNIELPEGTTEVPMVTAEANNANATVEVEDAGALPGTTSVRVTAQDGVTNNTYSINFTVFMPSTDATLSDLLVDGATINGFNAGTLTYEVVLPSGTTVVPEVSAVANDPNATSVEINPATALPGATTVTVTAEDGTTQLTYTINFSVVQLSADASLSDLQVDGSTVTGFAPTTLAYEVLLPSGTTVVPTVTATPTSANAMVLITDASGLPGSTSILVTAEDGTSTSTYTIAFTVEIESEFDDGLLTNGDFQEGDDGSWAGNGFNIVMEGGNSYNQVNIETAGNPSDVSLTQNVTLTERENYNLTFNASSDRNRTILVGIGSIANGEINSSETINLTSNSQTFSLNLSAFGFSGSDSRVFFDMGGETGIVTIDSVALFENGELLTNGDFELGNDGSWSGNAFNLDQGNFNFANVAVAGNSFDVNLSQTGLTIEPDANYLLSFEASTSPETGTRSIIAGIGLTGAPFNADTETVTLTDTQTKYTLELTANGEGQDGSGPFGGTGNCRVLFDMGADVGIVVIDNVSLIKVD